MGNGVDSQLDPYLWLAISGNALDTHKTPCVVHFYMMTQRPERLSISVERNA